MSKSHRLMVLDQIRLRDAHFDHLKEKARDPIRYPDAAGYLMVLQVLTEFLTALDRGDHEMVVYWLEHLRRVARTPKADPE